MAKFRLWDTENKKIVWAVDKSDHKKVYQVWTNDDGSKLYIYKKNGWVELDQTKEDAKEYGPVWKALDDEMVGYYLTNEPTDLYNWDSGDEVSYIFKDWDGTVLESGTIDEGETPTPPADPTREPTAEYIYTFSGWNPAVGPIKKKTEYVAQYTVTPITIPNNIAIDENSIDLLVDGDSKIEITVGREVSIVPSGKYIGKGIDTVLASIEPITLIGSLVTCVFGEDPEGIIYGTVSYETTGVFDSEFMGLVQLLYNSYSEEKAAALKTYIESKSVTIEEGATEMVSWNLVKITGAVNDSNYGRINLSWLNVAPGVEPVINGNQVEFPTFGGGNNIINVEPNEGYTFVRWDNVPQVVTGATTITAILEEDPR